MSAFLVFVEVHLVPVNLLRHFGVFLRWELMDSVNAKLTTTGSCEETFRGSRSLMSDFRLRLDSSVLIRM